MIVDPHYDDWIQPGVYSPPSTIPGVWYTRVLPNYPNLREKGKMGEVIGQKGKHFIRITKQSGCTYIWYEPTKNLIEIWGRTNEVVDRALLLLHRHLSWFSPPPLYVKRQNPVNAINAINALS